MLSFDVICIGDAKIDIFLSLLEENPNIHLNRDTKELCVAYGQKIPVDACSLQLGGNAYNVAVGLAKLQMKTAVMAEIGKDEFSQKIINGLQSENVNTDFLLQNANSPSSFSVILSFQQERTIFSKHIEREHNFSFDGISTKWIYLTSLGNEWEKTYELTEAFAKSSGSKLAFNPGTLQLLTGYQKIKSVLAISDMLFVNKEEAITILNIKNQISNNELLISLQKLGPKIVVITDGENGSFAVNEKGEFLTQAIIKTAIVEKTGAGDAYASGFLAAMLSNLPIQTAMKWGTINASATMAIIGAQNGLLPRKEMEEKSL
ncbi:MAG: carbohydrate kinase family protein [Candidatus Levybacteria bacterium]|nr:carbohydrate kinase family protein [Candidatus Levybacteria bacterium]